MNKIIAFLAAVVLSTAVFLSPLSAVRASADASDAADTIKDSFGDAYSDLVDLYPYLWREWLDLGKSFPQKYLATLKAFVDYYLAHNPGKTILDAYKAFKQDSDVNVPVEPYAPFPSDLIDKLFFQYLLSQTEEELGTTIGDTWTSPDGSIRITHEEVCDRRFTYYQATNFLCVYVDGVLCNNYHWEDKYYTFNYTSTYLDEANLKLKSPSRWWVKGTTIYYTYWIRSSGQLVERQGNYEFGRFITASSPVQDIYNITDNSDHSWRYDPITNNFIDGDGNSTPFIDRKYDDDDDLDFSKFFELLMKFLSSSQNQNLSVLELLDDILAALGELGNFGGGNYDPSEIKVEVQGYDYTSLLQAINAAIISIANYMPTLEDHKDAKDIIAILQGILNNTAMASKSYNYTEQLAAILSKLDAIIALQGIEVAEDLLKDLTDSELLILAEYSELCVTIVNILPTALIDTTLASLQTALFTSTPPVDLGFDYKGQSIVFISTSAVSSFETYIHIAKVFISLIVFYFWLLRMRSKFSDVF